MTKYPDNTSGRCLCGAVRYEITAAPLSVIFCHCESCRRHTGAPIVALAGYKADQVTYTKHTPRYFSSSEGVRRAFCGDCGTPLTWEGDGGDIGPMIEILVATMDQPESFAPDFHIHHAERLPWMNSLDTLPCFREWHDDGELPYLNAPDE